MRKGYSFKKNKFIASSNLSSLQLTAIHLKWASFTELDDLCFSYISTIFKPNLSIRAAAEHFWNKVIDDTVVIMDKFLLNTSFSPSYCDHSQKMKMTIFNASRTTVNNCYYTTSLTSVLFSSLNKKASHSSQWASRLYS